MTDALNHAQYLEGFYVSEVVPSVKARAIAATLRSQHAEIERLRAALVRRDDQRPFSRHDALRYRWLRDSMAYEILCDFPCDADGAKPSLPFGREKWPTALDAAIDGAMSDKPTNNRPGALLPERLVRFALRDLRAERRRLDGFLALGNESLRSAEYDDWIAALEAYARQYGAA